MRVSILQSLPRGGSHAMKNLNSRHSEDSIRNPHVAPQQSNASAIIGLGCPKIQKGGLKTNHVMKDYLHMQIHSLVQPVYSPHAPTTADDHEWSRWRNCTNRLVFATRTESKLQKKNFTKVSTCKGHTASLQANTATQSG